MASTKGTSPRSSKGRSSTAKPSDALPQRRLAPDHPLAQALAGQMRDAVLPGDTQFNPAELADAAAFLADAAARREPGEPVVRLLSATEGRRMLRIALVNDNQPFLVDSVAATIAAHGIAIDRLVHPVVAVRRSAEGTLEDIGEEAGDGSGLVPESMIYLETDRVDARLRRDLEKALRQALADVHVAVRDWPKLREAMRADAAGMADREAAALLEWLEGGMLTQLGHMTRHRDCSHSALLGVCRRSARDILAEASCDRAFDWFDDPKKGAKRDLLVIKANRISLVHRRVPLDLFIVPVREAGKVTALSIHAGVWTSAALAASPGQVPVLRAHVAALMDKLDLDPSGHAGKSLVHALTALPHDLTIGFASRDIERVSTAMMSLVDRPRPRLALVEAPLARHLFAFVWMPRDLLSTQIRLQIQQLVEQGTGADLLDWSLQVEGSTLAMLRFVLDMRGEREARHDEAALDSQLQTLLRGWGEAVESELALTMEQGRAAAFANRFADAFPTGYRAHYGPREAALDIGRLRDAQLAEGEASRPGPHRAARLFTLPEDHAGELRLKLYEHEGSLPLSDAVPALENFGFRVLEENPTSLAGGKLGTIHDFRLALPAGDTAAPLLERADTIERAIATVLNQQAENDPFNRLVTGTGLSAGEADWLRAFYRYLRQTGMGYTIYTVVDALYRAPQVTRGLIALFRARHEPGFGGGREKAAGEARSAIRQGLARVTAINDDRLLRLYLALIEAILRTNAFAAAGEEALAFKIDSALVPGLPRPVPWREIWVYSRRVEGIHLRSGPVARGGLRWSDRRDDFRTEILGLMKAQRVKNAVIVPTGAKGGFYPKQLPDPAIDRDGWAAEGQASYEVFIRTLLSITDNIVDGKIVHPVDVEINDGEDPYFVVAADKGTARFSDIANAIAEAHDFWLDDAFASGGSNGYDHKAMGITARGAWVSVQRHFLEMGVDVQRDPVRVAGCGDMSGDVFGNGMLLSKSILLVAAFDHRHIFIDPDPDAAASWKERSRMFALPRSSWDDYDKSLISRGGGVWPRSAKTIKLPKAAAAALGLEPGDYEPDTLISAILRAPVDLLWFGGIGTYVKASHENNVAVGDPANDALRVDAADVRAKVIGEGANLGVTQAARIEFALSANGRINTDFIDNSAGVDCSDNEVNIKIALAAAKRAGKLSEKARIKLLAEMTDEVAAIVLEDNRLQALALSIAETGGPRAMAAQMHLIDTLEAGGNLDRRTEGLADNQTLQRRAADGQGLTRPELAVLLSSSKLVLQDAIETSTLPDDPALESTLFGAFPAPMRSKFKAQIASHRLRREIIATKLANRIVNRLGIIHPFELAEEEGVDLSQVAAAFVTVESLFGLDQLWSSLETTAMPEAARLMLFDRLAAAVGNLMSDVLRTAAGQVAPSRMIADLGKGVRILAEATDGLLSAESKTQSKRLRDHFSASGAPERLAAQVALLYDCDGSVGLARLAQETGIDPVALTRGFTSLGAALGLDWAQSTAALMNPSDVWERLLVDGLARDFQQMRLDLLRRLAARKGARKDLAEAVARWSEDHGPAVRQFRTMVSRAQSQTPVAPAMLAQIASMARNLLVR
ncbi:MAG: glutamate dehydrogenase [Erythrobacter sp. 34-65-8]|nr:MAG: glutamate dehydrogenase [Erythrobacter sp. 34-65-8]